MIEFKNLRKCYPGAAAPALNDVSFSIPGGGIYGVLGPNGAGKSTLIGVLTGLLKADTGEIRIDNALLPRHTGELLGVVPQELAFYPDLTVAENLRLFADLAGVPRNQVIERCQQVVGYTALAEHLGKRAAALSGGLKRRLNLAIGLLNEPKILCLDEPTVGIDPHSRHFILNVIRALSASGMTVLYTSHYMDEVEKLCDRLVVLDHGRILAEGRTAELLARPEAGGSLESLFLALTENQRPA